MARTRMIKPEFFRDEALIECDFATRLLFAGLWTLADREGRLEDKPRRIKLELFPADTVDVEPMLAQLAEFELIVRYEVDGRRYIQVRSFHKHQRPHVREIPSTIPAPPRYDPLGINPGSTRVPPGSPEYGIRNTEYGNRNPAAAAADARARATAAAAAAAVSEPDFFENDEPEPQYVLVDYGETYGFEPTPEPVIDERWFEEAHPGEPRFEQDRPSQVSPPPVPAAPPEPPPFGAIHRAWEEHIGPLSRSMAEMIDAAVEEWPEQWLLDAIREAVAANARNWRYVTSILQRWQRDGRDRRENGGCGPDTSAEQRKARYGRDDDQQRRILAFAAANPDSPAGRLQAAIRAGSAN